MCVNDCTYYIKEVFMINFKRIFAGVMAAATAVSLRRALTAEQAQPLQQVPMTALQAQKQQLMTR